MGFETGGESIRDVEVAPKTGSRFYDSRRVIEGGETIPMAMRTLKSRTNISLT